MAIKNGLSDLNNFLFASLESITDEDLTKEEETVEFSKEEIDAIAKPKRTQNNRGGNK